MSEADIPAVVDFINELEQLEPMGEASRVRSTSKIITGPTLNILLGCCYPPDAAGNEVRIIGRGLSTSPLRRPRLQSPAHPSRL